MTTQILFNVLSAIQPLSVEFKSALEKELVKLSFPKHHVLLAAPAIADHAWFLENGFAMAYIYLDGKKIVENFWKSGQIMLSSNSFFEQVPSEEFIQLMEVSEVLSISYAGVQRLFAAYPEAQALYRIIMNRHYESCRNRIHDMQRLTAIQRREKLLKLFPDIEQLVPQDYIASYLGIAPQSLSRIKKRER